LGIAASHHFLDGFADVGTLVGGDIFFVEVKPAVPMVDEYLPEAVAAVSGLWVEKHDRLESKPGTRDSVQGLSQAMRFSIKRIRVC
jgi:hypothetical protein